MERKEFRSACQEGGALVERALVRLHRDYGQALWREGWRALRDSEAARDLVQETLLKVWRHCASYRGDSELYPWMVSILRRTAIDQMRRRRPEEPLVDDNDQWRPEVEQAWSDQRGQVRSEPLNALQERQREALFRECANRFAADHPQMAEVLRWIAEDDLKPADVAQLIGRNAGATREYLSQCRKRARHYFAAWYAALDEGHT